MQRRCLWDSSTNSCNVQIWKNSCRSLIMISEHRRRRFEWIVNKSTINSNSCYRFCVLVFSSLRFLNHKRSSRDVLATLDCDFVDVFSFCDLRRFLLVCLRRLARKNTIDQLLEIRCFCDDSFCCFVCDFDHEHLVCDVLDEHVHWFRDCRDSWVIQWMNIQTSN